MLLPLNIPFSRTIVGNEVVDGGSDDDDDYEIFRKVPICDCTLASYRWSPPTRVSYDLGGSDLST